MAELTLTTFWPRITDPADLIAVKLNTFPKYVASRTRTAFSWSETSLVRGVVKAVDDIKKRYQREVQVHGSCGLAQTLIENDLIDESRSERIPRRLVRG